MLIWLTQMMGKLCQLLLLRSSFDIQGVGILVCWFEFRCDSTTTNLFGPPRGTWSSPSNTAVFPWKRLILASPYTSQRRSVEVCDSSVVSFLSGRNRNNRGEVRSWWRGVVGFSGRILQPRHKISCRADGQPKWPPEGNPRT